MGAGAWADGLGAAAASVSAQSQLPQLSALAFLHLCLGDFLSTTASFPLLPLLQPPVLTPSSFAAGTLSALCYLAALCPYARVLPAACRAPNESRPCFPTLVQCFPRLATCSLVTFSNLHTCTQHPGPSRRPWHGLRARPLCVRGHGRFAL